LVIEIGIDPTIELGPVTLAWHGITIALGIVIGGVATARYRGGRGSTRSGYPRSGCCSWSSASWADGCST
jgi:prolipoprotein diacylglyceryltransferase